MSATEGYWTGALAAPLPIVVLMVVILALSVGLSETLVVFVGLAYAVVLIPLALAHAIARWTGSRRLRTYAGAMFTIVFVAIAGGWQLLEFGPDSSITIDFDDGVEWPVPLPLAGVIAGLLAALVEVLCVVIFWWLAVRPTLRAEAPA